MGANNGTGQPNWFQCSKCRRRKPPYGSFGFSAACHRGALNRVRLTGRKRPVTTGKGGPRNSMERREFECMDCGHIGWSRHVDLQHKEERANRP